MTNPKEDIQKLREFIASVATPFAIEAEKRLQVRFNFTDCLDGNFDIIIGPAISWSRWPKELVEVMKKPPISVDIAEGCSETCRYLYHLPLASLPIDLRRRRGQSISAANRLAQIVAYSCSLRTERANIEECKERLPQLRKINVSSMIATLDLRLAAVEVELRKQEREQELMDEKKMGEQNQLLFIDIARHLGLEEGPAISLDFHVKNSVYPLAHRYVPYGVTKVQ